MRSRRVMTVVGAVAVLAAWPTVAFGPRMTGQPRSFPRSVQSSPAIAVDLNPNHHPETPIVAIGANDTFDQGACVDADCAFTPFVGISGIFFSLDGGGSWFKPLYKGWTVRKGKDFFGPIRTLPLYYKKHLVTRGDPSLAFGPNPTGPGSFDWAAGSRLYYATIVRDRDTADQGYQAIAVSVTADAEAAAQGTADPSRDVPSPWMGPRVVSSPEEVLADKPGVWADNVQSSPYFGRAYVCWATFDTTEPGATDIGSDPTGTQNPIRLSLSRNGGRSWQPPVELPVPAGETGGRQGCSVRTDSAGAVYVFWEEYGLPTADDSQTSRIMLARSTDGGQTFPTLIEVAGGIRDVGQTDDGQQTRTFDGKAGARTNSWPSVSVANGAPLGPTCDGTCPPGRYDPDARIVVVWPDARSQQAQALVAFSSTGGDHWSAPQSAGRPQDSTDFPAIAISPNGEHVYLTYDAFLDGTWHSDTSAPRTVRGVTRAASFAKLQELEGTDRAATAWSTDHIAEAGDARGSSNLTLTAEYMGDYNGAAATDERGFAVWVDLASVHRCDAVDQFRDGSTRPIDLPLDCHLDFGGTDLKTRAIDPR